MNGTSYFPITTTNKALCEEWFSRALADDTVWPFMSFDKRTTSAEVIDDDWNRLTLMDSSQNALLEWFNDRGNGLHSAKIEIWSLRGPKKQIAAGRLLSAIPHLVRRYGVSYIDAACHASNRESAYILTNRFGAPWGRKPSNAWNGLTGVFEDSLHFRKATT